MTRTLRTRMHKWIPLMAAGILFGGTCDAVLGTLSLVANIVGIWV